MNKLLLAISACAMLLATAPQANAVDPNEETVIMIGIPVMNHESPGFVHSTCGGSAPLEHTCDTGDHVRGGTGYIRLGFPTAQPGLTATLEAVLTHANGEVRFQCSWDDGSFQSCRVLSVSWPALGADFTFGCNSYFNVPLTLPEQIPGGIGDWECFVEHYG